MSTRFLLRSTVLSFLASTSAQSLQCPATLPKPNSFLVIGGGGGDAEAACENTLAATEAGLRAGINAVEVDVSLSKDQVLFLWKHPNPLDAASVARSQGLFASGMCRPRFNTISRARDLVFNNVRKVYDYVNQDGWRVDVEIPTLEDWMDKFAMNASLERIYINLRDTEVGLSDLLVNSIFEKASKLGVSSKVRLLSADFSMTGALQSSLGRRGLDISIASRSFGEDIAAVRLGSDDNFNAVGEANDECYDSVPLAETISGFGWRGYQYIIKRMVTKRNDLQSSDGRYHSIISVNFDSVEKISWLMCAGVDGIVTNKVSLLSNLNLRRVLGLVQCCTEERELPCLQPLDIRVTGQGCSTLGINWGDEEINRCPLFDLDLFSSGVKLKCAKRSFCSTL